MKADSILRGDEGMWPLNMVPKERIRKLYRANVDDAWLMRVQRASVRMNNGGSASFVSPNGLIATNHHVAADVLYSLSSERRNLMRDGYLASSKAKELKAPQLEVNVLWEIEDVTDEVESSLKGVKSLKDRQKKRRAAIARIEKDSKDRTGLRSDVVTLYNGGLYHLYRYRKYTDVRLVFAPESAIASYGGDIDNYEYPRYSLDVTFFRVYENGKPIRSPEWFRWSTGAPVMGQALFIAGHPGSTDRLTTYDRIRLMRDEGMPKLMDYIHRQEVLLQQFSGRSPEHARRADDRLHSIQNVRKRYAGQLAAIQSTPFTEALRRREDLFRREISKRPKIKKKVGRAWEEVAAASAYFSKRRNEYLIFEGGRGFNTRFFSLARTIVRLAEEDTKPNARRLEEYGEARRESLLDRLYSPAPIYKDLEEHLFTDALRYLVETLGFNDSDVVRILKGRPVEEVAREYIARTKLDSVAERKRLVRGGAKAVRSSKDPFIQLALLVDARARKIRKLIETNVETVIEDAYGRIARGLFEVYGNALYPDATFTLRLAHGFTTPYGFRKVPEPKYSTIGGVFAHGALHEHQGPWKLPPSWEKNKKVLQKDRSAFNFLTSHDTHGGNSGSPVFTKDLKITGLLFDGLVETQGGDSFMYMSEAREHTVCVHTQGILSVLKKVYKAKALVRELMGK